MKVAIVCAKGLNSFTAGIGSVLARKHEVREYLVETAGDIDRATEWADVLWCEWANQVAGYVSEANKKPCVVRMHRYEAHTGLVKQVKWENVRALVSTSRHVLDFAAAKVEGLEKLTRCVVIPSGIDLSKWPLQKHDGSQHRIGVVSYVHGRKQPGIWLHLLTHLPRKWHLYHAGTFQEPEWVPYLRLQAKLLDREENIHFDGWVSDVASWWKDKDYCLSASMDEGCPYNVIEAAACGVKPVVHEYVGAREQFSGDWLWHSAERALDMLRPEFTGCPRGDIESRYSLDAQAPEILEVVERAAS